LIIGETTMKPTVPAQTIPVVQLSQFLSGNAAERAQFVQTMGRSLETLGFFALTDHGVDRSLIQQAYAPLRQSSPCQQPLKDSMSTKT
jgi:isopenicillin N synthase-like dioxygenase